MGEWIVLTPLVPALLLLVYMAWQCFKEIKPTMQEVKSLQRKIQNTKEIISELIPDVQSIQARIMQQREVAQDLVVESTETYGKVKEVFHTVAALDTLPLRRGINYLKQKREERKVPEKVRHLADKARDISAMLDQREIRQATTVAALLAGVTALFFALRKSS